MSVAVTRGKRNTPGRSARRTRTAPPADRELSDDEIRMIVRLRSHQTRKWVGPRTYYYNYTRVWTDEQIGNLFGVSADAVGRAAMKFFRPRHTAEEIRLEVLKFAKEHDRWPTRKDFRAKRLSISDKNVYTYFPGRSFEFNSMDEVIWQIVRTSAKSLSPRLVLSIRNLTVRRDAITNYGIEKLVKKGQGKLLHEDASGKLWRLPTDNRNDKFMLYLEVVNSTANSDGSYDHYFLRVPPTIRSAHQAKAWTVGVTDGWETWQPVAES